MTAETRFDRDLPAILEDLYLGPSPDYRDEVMAAAVRTRQRPSWTFAGRWFPVADIATRPALAPRLPWRTIGAALIVIALILAAAIAVAGSRQTKVPPPFGPARNGLIAYAVDGDIYTVDPPSGVATAIVTGPTADSEPAFSLDGTRIAFRRSGATSGSPADDIVVVNADGSHPFVVNAKPFPGGPGGFEWAADSGSLLVSAAAQGDLGSATIGSPADENAVWLLSADGPATPPRALAVDGAYPYAAASRPPDGKAILINRPIDGGEQLLVLDIATGEETPLATARSTTIDDARWSPDGSRVVYSAVPSDDPDSRRLFIVNADGTGTRQLTDAPGTWVDIDTAWSPDGTRIAYGRYERVSDGAWVVRPTAVLTVADGTIRSLGPTSRQVRQQQPTPADQYASPEEGMLPEWSPDGGSVIAYPTEATGHPVIISAVDGTWSTIPQLVEPSSPSQLWQRRAP